MLFLHNTKLNFNLNSTSCNQELKLRTPNRVNCEKTDHHFLISNQYNCDLNCQIMQFSRLYNTNTYREMFWILLYGESHKYR